MKSEDLVTDKQEKEDEALMSQSTRSLWDRPMPRPQYDWPHDPRMPAEWNTVIASMRAYKGNHTIPRGEIYRQPEEDEASEPEEFMNRLLVDSARLDHLRKQETLQLGNWKTDTE